MRDETGLNCQIVAGIAIGAVVKKKKR